MKRASFLLLTLVCLFVVSLACASDTSNDPGATETTGTLTTVAPTTPPSTTPPPALNISWTDPQKPVAVMYGADMLLNFRGEGTSDPNATITVGVDDDTVEGNGVLEWFDRSFTGGPFLVTIDVRDFQLGTYYFIAKISRGGETVSAYLEEPFSVNQNLGAMLTSPANDIVTNYDSFIPFAGFSNPAPGSIVRVMVDTDRNPTNGFRQLLADVDDTGNINYLVDVPQNLDGRYYLCINAHSTNFDTFDYADGAVQIGDSPSVLFTSPINQISVHPQPPVTVNIAGSATAATPGATLSIGYDDDSDFHNGVTWIQQDMPVGDFDFDWTIDITTGGTYRLVGYVVDGGQQYYNYGPAEIQVIGGDYIDIYEPLTSFTMVAGTFLPFPVSGYAYSEQGGNDVVVFYDDDNNFGNGVTVIGTSPEGAFTEYLDVTVLPPGEYVIGAYMQVGFTPLYEYAPMTLTIEPNTDISTPLNSGPYFSAVQSYNEQDPDRTKFVPWMAYYPVDNFGDTTISSDGPFPLIVFMPDDSMSFLDYDYLAKRLAQWGYIVAVINTNFNFGLSETVRAEMDAEDAVFVMTWFLNANADAASEFYTVVDINNSGVGGHGRGGSAAVIASHNDERFDAVIALGGKRMMYREGNQWRYYRVNAPVMIMEGSESLLYPHSTNVALYGSVSLIYSNRKILATIEGGNHLQFKDFVGQWDPNAGSLDSLH
ncbi:MAG: hypothetical protein U5N86_01720 [Planctomycetota bacterium]|nr:hypothetical protein [Planctomycetota bacterium]